MTCRNKLKSADVTDTQADKVNEMRTAAKRGAFIVFEGCDRAGKSSQCVRLHEHLVSSLKMPACLLTFPDRSTSIGAMIDQYLKASKDLNDQVIHLLFAANRWEKVKTLQNALEDGVTVIADRYAFSGVAFSAAKAGMDLEWCKQPDRGLPRPDMVIFLDVSAEAAAKRGGFGEERYEQPEFQVKVRTNYGLLMDQSWKLVDTSDRSPDEVFQLIQKAVMPVLQETAELGPVQPLWPLRSAV